MLDREQMLELNQLTTSLQDKIQEAEELQARIEKLVAGHPSRRARAAEAVWSRPVGRPPGSGRKLKKNGKARKPFVMTAARRAAMSENLRKAREARLAKIAKQKGKRR